jgi:hypothetical protein
MDKNRHKRDTYKYQKIRLKPDAGSTITSASLQFFAKTETDKILLIKVKQELRTIILPYIRLKISKLMI